MSGRIIELTWIENILIQTNLVWRKHNLKCELFLCSSSCWFQPEIKISNRNDYKILDFKEFQIIFEAWYFLLEIVWWKNIIQWWSKSKIFKFEISSNILLADILAVILKDYKLFFDLISSSNRQSSDLIHNFKIWITFPD